MKIILNGEILEVKNEFMTYEELVELCNCSRSKKALHTIVCSYPNGKCSLPAPGSTILIVDNMSISSVVTDGA